MKRLLQATVLGLGIIATASVFAACQSSAIISKPRSMYNETVFGTALDTKTQLMWQKCSVGMTYTSSCTGTASLLTWDEAHKAAITANAANANGFNDWRVPNKNELASLLEDACYSPAINSSVFTATSNDYYWTSSPYAGDVKLAWYVKFDLGFVSTLSKFNKYYVRLVRNG